MVTHIARVWIIRVRLPVLHVVSSTGKMNVSLSAFVPENLVSRDGFGSPVPRQPAHLHTQAESGIGYYNCLGNNNDKSLWTAGRTSPFFILVFPRKLHFSLLVVEQTWDSLHGGMLPVRG